MPPYEGMHPSASEIIRLIGYVAGGADGFVAENYAEMRDARLFSALVPAGGGNGVRRRFDP
jgi:hypothetical protein